MKEMTIEQMQERTKHCKRMGWWYRILTFSFYLSLFLMVVESPIAFVVLIGSFVLAFCVLGYDLVAGRIK